MEKMKRTQTSSLLFLISLVLVIALSGCGGSSAPKVDWELKVSGAVDNPLTLTFNDLVDMPQLDLAEIMMEKSTGEDEITSWSGVPVDEIFKKVGASSGYVTITALAADGYAIEISKDELQGAIVALKDKGEWIAEVTPDKGPVRLVCPETPGNRWVFQLQEIIVNK
jgi:DMSO/TMAO reductase YedYZ molybdopterin-dependent catalytic subunit